MSHRTGERDYSPRVIRIDPEVIRTQSRAAYDAYERELMERRRANGMDAIRRARREQLRDEARARMAAAAHVARRRRLRLLKSAAFCIAVAGWAAMLLLI